MRSRPIRLRWTAPLQRKLAETFINEVAPDYAERQPSMRIPMASNCCLHYPEEARHQLRFERIVNGITFTANYIDMEMDSDDVQGY